MIAGLEAIVLAAAFLAALIALAAVLRPLIVATLGQAPFIGGWLASNVDNGLNGFVRAITPGANAAFPVLAGLLWVVYSTAYGWLAKLADAAEAVFWALYNLRTLTLPQAIATAQSYLEGLLGQLRQDALSWVAGLRNEIAASALQIEAYALSASSAAAQAVLGALRAAESDLAARILKVEADAGALFQKAESDALQAVRNVEATVSQDVAGLRQLTAQSLSVIESDISALEEQAGAQLPELIRNVAGEVTALRLQTEAQIPELAHNTEEQINAIRNSREWLILTELVSTSDSLRAQGVSDLIGLVGRATRTELAQVASLRRQLEPAIAEARAVLRRALESAP